MSKIEILKTAGKWLINGKSYNDCNLIEKWFFDGFLREMKIN